MKVKALLTILVTGALVCVLSGSRNMDIVAQKNFPLVCSLYSDEAASICSSDKTLQALAESKRTALQNAGIGPEAAKILLFTEEEIESAVSLNLPFSLTHTRDILRQISAMPPE